MQRQIRYGKIRILLTACLLLTSLPPAQAQDTAALSGKATVTEDLVETRVLGYISLCAVSTGIAGRVIPSLNAHTGSAGQVNPSLNKHTVAIYDGSVAELMASYQTDRKIIAAMIARFDAANTYADTVLNNPRYASLRSVTIDAATARREEDRAVTDALAPVTASIGAVSDVVESFVGLLSFFRTNIDLKSVTVTADNTTFVPHLLGALKRACPTCTFYNPKVVPPNLMNISSSEILSELEELYTRRDTAENLLAELNKLINNLKPALNNKRLEASRKIAALDLQIAEQDEVIKSGAKLQVISRAETEKKRLKGERLVAEDEKRGAEDLLALVAAAEPDWKNAAQRLTGLLEYFRAFITGLTKFNENTGRSILMTHLLAENITNILKNDRSAYLLEVGINVAGGTRRIKQHLILDVFRGGPSITNSGAASARFSLFDNNGRVITAGSANKYIDYQKGKNIQEIADQNCQ